MFPVNYLAVVLAAAANFVIGFLFHGPVLGKKWMELANIHPTGNEKFSDMVPQMTKNFLVNLIFAYVLAVMCLFASTSPFLGGSAVVSGMAVAFLVWLGFLVTSTSIPVIWMGGSARLWRFELFSSLVASLAMGAIIGAL